MLQRIKKDKFYKNVKICEKWKDFENFKKDIKQIKNYEEWFKNPGKYNLDKDLLSDENNKIYSPETCCFITERKNKSLSNSTGKKIKILNFDGETLSIEETIVEASEKYKTRTNLISDCLRKKIYQINNLIFCFEDETEDETLKRFEKIDRTKQIKIKRNEKFSRLSEEKNLEIKKRVISKIINKNKTSKYLEGIEKIEFYELPKKYYEKFGIEKFKFRIKKNNGGIKMSQCDLFYNEKL